MERKILSRLLPSILLACLLLPPPQAQALPPSAPAPYSQFDMKEGQLIRYSGAVAAVTIPDGVTAISAQAFGENSTLTSITLPASVQEIAPFTFSRCPALREVRLSEGLLTIGMHAFSDTQLQRVVIPDSVAYIGQGAFLNCASLTEVHLPATTEVEWDSFYNTPWAAANVTVLQEAHSLMGVTGRSEYHTTAAPSAPATTNGDFTLSGTTVTGYSGKGGEIVLPDGVTLVGARAFYQNTSITGVTVPDSLRAFGQSAFEGCTALRRVSPVADGFLFVGKDAFQGCANLESLDMPSSTPCSGNPFAGTPYEASRGQARLLENRFTPSRQYAGQFPDATENLWCYSFFVRVYETGLMDGKSDGRFHPDSTLTVAESAKLAATAHAMATGNTARLRPSDPWYQSYYDYLERYSQLNMDGWRDPGRPIRRNEFAALMINALPQCEWSKHTHQLSSNVLPDLAVTRDGQTQDIGYADEVRTLYHAGVCAKYDDGKFHPERNITRAEAAVMLARTIDPSLRLPIQKS